MRKGQMSLEMIIGLLILLVVAVVIIRMFISKVGGGDIKPPEETLKFIEFKAECESLCNSFLNYGTKASLSNYCSKRLLGVDDLNGNSVIDSFDADTLSLKICEDMVYCFQIVPCKTKTGMITWEQCRQSMCNAKYEVYQNWDKADEKVLELVPGPGSCVLPEDENWWNLYFGSKPCTNPGKGPTGEEFSLSLGDCTIDSSDWTFECDINSITGECGTNNNRLAVGIVQLDANGNEDRSSLVAANLCANVGSIQINQNTLSGNLEIPAGSNAPSTNGRFYLWCDLDCDQREEFQVNKDVIIS